MYLNEKALNNIENLNINDINRIIKKDKNNIEKTFDKSLKNLHETKKKQLLKIISKIDKVDIELYDKYGKSFKNTINKIKINTIKSSKFTLEVLKGVGTLGLYTLYKGAKFGINKLFKTKSYIEYTILKAQEEKEKITKKLNGNLNISEFNKLVKVLTDLRKNIDSNNINNFKKLYEKENTQKIINKLENIQTYKLDNQSAKIVDELKIFINNIIRDKNINNILKNQVKDDEKLSDIEKKDFVEKNIKLENSEIIKKLLDNNDKDNYNPEKRELLINILKLRKEYNIKYGKEDFYTLYENLLNDNNLPELKNEKLINEIFKNQIKDLKNKLKTDKNKIKKEDFKNLYNIIFGKENKDINIITNEEFKLYISNMNLS